MLVDHFLFVRWLVKRRVLKGVPTDSLLGCEISWVFYFFLAICYIAAVLLLLFAIH